MKFLIIKFNKKMKIFNINNNNKKINFVIRKNKIKNN